MDTGTFQLLAAKPDYKTEGRQATHNSTAPVTATSFATLCLSTEPCLACGAQVQFGSCQTSCTNETEGQQTYYVTNSTGYTVKPFTDNYYLSPACTTCCCRTSSQAQPTITGDRPVPCMHLALSHAISQPHKAAQVTWRVEGSYLNVHGAASHSAELRR